MAKKSGSSSRGGSKTKEVGLTPQKHREIAQTLQARARLHHAKADLEEAKNPPKKKSTYPGCY